MDKVTVTESNIDQVRTDMPCDITAELRVGCIVSRSASAWLCIWPDAGRAAVCYGGDSAWGDYDAVASEITLDDRDSDSNPVVIGVDDYETCPVTRGKESVA